MSQCHCDEAASDSQKALMNKKNRKKYAMAGQKRRILPPVSQRHSISGTKKNYINCFFMMSFWLQTELSTLTNNSMGFNIQKSVQMHHECPNKFASKRHPNSTSTWSPNPPQSWFRRSFHHSAISAHRQKFKKKTAKGFKLFGEFFSPAFQVHTWSFSDIDP